MSYHFILKICSKWEKEMLKPFSWLSTIKGIFTNNSYFCSVSIQENRDFLTILSWVFLSHQFSAIGYVLSCLEAHDVPWVDESLWGQRLCPCC